MMHFYKDRKVVVCGLVLVILALAPWFANQFWTKQILSQSFIMGTIALSMTFLSSYLGAVSFAQVTMAGAAGYAIAYFGVNTAGIGYTLPWVLTVLVALFVSSLVGFIIGFIARKSFGIYTIMITLAIGMAFFFLTRQNYTIFNGWNGFAGLRAPEIGGMFLGDPIPLYYLALLVSVILLVLVYCFVRSPLGLVIQGVRDNMHRISAVGISVQFPIVVAYTFSGFIAGCGGVLSAWYYDRVSSDSVGLNPILDILIISVIGGMKHPIGAYLGAFVYILIDTLAIDLIARERFNTAIGAVLLLIVILSPDGITGFLQLYLSKQEKVIDVLYKYFPLLQYLLPRAGKKTCL